MTVFLEGENQKTEVELTKITENIIIFNELKMSSPWRFGSGQISLVSHTGSR